MALPNEEMDLARYKTAAAELDSAARDEGVWIKAFAESGGDENASKAMYIKLRVEQLRKNAVADAARRVVGEATRIPSANESIVGVSPTPAHAPAPALSAPQGPARVAKTLYDVVGVDRHADVAAISGAIQAKKSQVTDSSDTPEGRQRLEILLQNAAEVLLNPNKRRAYDERVFKVEVTPAVVKNTAIPNATYASQPVSGMIEAEDAKEMPSAGKKSGTYVGWLVVWFALHFFLATPTLKVHVGWLVSGFTYISTAILFLGGLLLVHNTFKVSASGSSQRVWLAMGLAVLVLIGLRIYSESVRRSVAAVAAEAESRRIAAAAEDRVKSEIAIANRNAAVERAELTQRRKEECNTLIGNKTSPWRVTAYMELCAARLSDDEFRACVSEVETNTVPYRAAVAVAKCIGDPRAVDRIAPQSPTVNAAPMQAPRQIYCNPNYAGGMNCY